MRRWLSILGVATLAVACADDEAASPAADATVIGGDVDLPPEGQAAFIDVRLEPRAPFYTLEDRPTLTATVYDREDAVLEDEVVTWRVEPAGRVDGGALVPAAEGQGSAWACVGDVCGVAHFFVDQQPPALTVEVPTRAARIVGDDTILVAGEVEDSSGADVYVNDVPADRQGTRYEARIPARFGLNRIDVVAYDGVRPPVREVREVLWAPEVLPVEADGVAIDDALLLRLDQALLDDDVPPPPPDETGRRAVRDLAGTLTAVIEAVDPVALLPPRIDAGPVSASIVDARLSPDTVDLTIADGGVELFVRLGVSLNLAGDLTLDGRRVGLGGELLALVAARAQTRLQIEANGPRVIVEGVEIGIEAINGALDDPLAQATLDTLGSTLRIAIEAYLDDLAARLVQERVQTLLDGLTLKGLGVLDGIPVPLPGLDLTLSFAVQAPEVRRATSLTLAMGARARFGAPIEPVYPSRGVFAEGLDAPPPWPAGGHLGLAVRLVAFNAVLHALWQAGALQLHLGDLGVMLGPLSGRVDARLPPILVPGEEGGPYPIVLQVGELDLFVGDDVEPNHYVVSLRAGVVLDTTDGQVRLDVAETPDVRVALLARGATPPIPPDGLKAVIESIVWGKVRDAIGPGLVLPLDQAALGPEQLGAFAPDLRALRLAPSFPTVPVVRDGWFALPADLTVDLQQ